MKKLVTSLLIIFSFTKLCAQNKIRDSLEALLGTEKTDTGRFYLFKNIGKEISYTSVKKDSATWYFQKALDLAKKINYTKGEIEVQLDIAENFYYTGNLPQALSVSLHYIKQAEEFKDTSDLFYLYRLANWIYSDMGDVHSALDYVKKMNLLVKSGFYKGNIYQNHEQITNASFSMVYSGLHKLDSALYFESLIYQYALETKDEQFLVLSPFWIANTYSEMGNTDSAFYYYRTSISNSLHSSRMDILPASKLGIAELFLKKNQTDSAFHYAWQSMIEFQNSGEYTSLIEVYPVLSKIYQNKGRYDSAFFYQQRYDEKKDSFFNQKKMSEVQNLAFNETLRDQQLNQDKKEAQLQYQNKIRIYIFSSVLLVILIIAFLLVINLQTRKRANILLQKQKKEIEEQKDHVEKTLTELKLTQNQLVQSEKMASLGELTAGIAHEIQNPLNFVNNFSSVNKELLEEMKDELKKGNIGEAFSITDNLISNEEKINQHGKRADAIVKSMLQHSRTSSGKKELTNINQLADEYLKLAYHAFKGKVSSLNVITQTDFDPGIGLINVVVPDLGRVLLNLYNNAFYSVTEKSKRLGESYKPAIVVSSVKSDDHFEIKVKDNGNGIAGKDIGKIFQPFFTTKPTGQGTGLGLSLSYDIIKANGGELKVNTKEGEFAEFIIELPSKLT